MPLRTDFARMNCSLARALEELGDPWTLLILRECMLGTERFEDFGAALGVSRKTLSDRLAAMQAHGLLARTALSAGGKHGAYRITEKAAAALPALVALMQWGDIWLSGAGNEPMQLVTPGGARIEPVGLRSASGRRIDAATLRVQPGPGADRRTRAHIARPRLPSLTSEASARTQAKKRP
jgi:DNA-binding HxlR family transcriptional regulator